MSMDTANLQSGAPAARGLTVKEAAALMNVSERQVYQARKLLRIGDPELIAAVDRGEMSIHEALRTAQQRPKPTRLDRLQAAFRACTDEERAWFLAQITIEDEQGNAVFVGEGAT
jgi:hypothetical protein